MSKIIKSADAPEGVLRISFGSTSFSVSDSEGYESDDFVVLDAARASRWLDVVDSDAPVQEPTDPVASPEPTQIPITEPVNNDQPVNSDVPAAESGSVVAKRRK